MKFRRRQRWLRRFALGFAFATALVVGKVSPAWAKFDDGGTSAHSVVPYVSTGITKNTSPSGDEIAIANAMADRKITSAEAVRDPYLTDVYVRQGESLGGPDGTQAFVSGVTDFPSSEPTPTRPDDQANRFTAPANPPVISYLSHGMGADGEVGARPDNRSDRFTPADGVSQPRVEVSSNSRDWDGAMTFGIGAVLLALALGLAFGYLRRPRLAL